MHSKSLLHGSYADSLGSVGAGDCDGALVLVGPVGAAEGIGEQYLSLWEQDLQVREDRPDEAVPRVPRMHRRLCSAHECSAEVLGADLARLW
eukprot:CAMPEP_0178477170 /NCGR_PEP_ID=MMETSP0696-20121128/3996_1 /TAXON_ID=265572 /ORGANISM="Extubocellulus spinifer, Strain CCMP396" /LENGTH=91 /DNA_ID=CAMNT_0020104479 /DNA_START=285 /DNA_END=558 /DNA_ORIENTATION=-